MIKIFYVGEDPVRGVTRTGCALKRATRLDLPVVNRFWPSTVSGTSRPCLSLVPTSSQTSSPPLPAMLNRRRYVKMSSSKMDDFPPSLWRHNHFALVGSKLRSSLNGQQLNFLVNDISLDGEEATGIAHIISIHSYTRPLHTHYRHNGLSQVRKRAAHERRARP